MLKAKLCGFAIACTVVFAGISPGTALATETDIQSITLSEKDWKEKKAEFEEDRKEACDKWEALSTKQKKEVYNLADKELQAKFKLVDKLVKLGVMDKDDAEEIKAHMSEKFKECKENEEFPFFRHKGRNDKK